MSLSSRFRLTAPYYATYILDTCKFLVSVFILANRRDVLLQIVGFFQMLTDSVTCLKSTRDNKEIYKNTNTTEERSMLSLRHEVTETQSSVEKSKTNRQSTELLFIELNSGNQMEVGRI